MLAPAGGRARRLVSSRGRVGEKGTLGKDSSEHNTFVSVPVCYSASAQAAQAAVLPSRACFRYGVRRCAPSRPVPGGASARQIEC